MDQQLSYLFNHIYEGIPKESVEEQYKPYDIGLEDILFHALAKQIAGKSSVKTAKMLREFKDGLVDEHFGTRFLKDFVKTSARISEDELRKYALKQDVQLALAHPADFLDTEGKFSHRFGNVFYDGKFNYCLMHNAELVAHIGFEPDDKKIQILQIQGVSGGVELLNRLEWKAALLTKVVKLAEQHKIPEVEIVSVVNNKWAKMTFEYLKNAGIYPEDWTFERALIMTPNEEKGLKEKIHKANKIGDGAVHLMPHRGFRIYDATALKSGFEKNKEGNYSKKTS